MKSWTECKRNLFSSLPLFHCGPNQIKAGFGDQSRLQSEAADRGRGPGGRVLDQPAAPPIRGKAAGARFPNTAGSNQKAPRTGPGSRRILRDSARRPGRDLSGRAASPPAGLLVRGLPAGALRAAAGAGDVDAIAGAAGISPPKREYPQPLIEKLMPSRGVEL